MNPPSLRNTQTYLEDFGQTPNYNSKRLIQILKGCDNVLLNGTGRHIQHPMNKNRQSSCYRKKHIA